MHTETGSGDFAVAEDGPVRVRIDLGYDGTDFAGWAAQPGQRTVAGVLQAALDLLFGSAGVSGPPAVSGLPGVSGPPGVSGLPGQPGSRGLTVAGRTDAGVHATGQVCHLDLDRGRWDALGGTLVRRLAGLLPTDVRVYSVAVVDPRFDARFSALFRRYSYRVSDSGWGAPVLRHRDTLAWPRPLDLDRLNDASAALLGEHDFAAYCRRKEHATTVRAIADLSWHRDSDGIVLATVRADAFCQAMVRSLVGALLPVGDGRRPVGWPGSLLPRRERASEIVVAPPHGLTLVEVGYPANAAEYAARAAQTRNLRVPTPN